MQKYIKELNMSLSGADSVLDDLNKIFSMIKQIENLLDDLAGRNITFQLNDRAFGQADEEPEDQILSGEER